MPATVSPSAVDPRRWSPPAVALAAGLGLVVGFGWRTLIYNDTNLQVAIQVSPFVTWGLRLGSVAVALAWLVAPPRVRGPVALAGGLAGVTWLVPAVLLGFGAPTTAGYLTVLGAVLVLVAGGLETARRFAAARGRLRTEIEKAGYRSRTTTNSARSRR
ncbi:hypothetical protein [Halosimplex halophilum]|uniref:hypothetical protein n=1 Tax=Halosimplex halophilum TaxID=2559572 RepID=UPI00107F7B8D|nr:hypothetical protein [Halosimplex halophilum]